MAQDTIIDMTPQEILMKAIERYRGHDGWDSQLVNAAWELCQLGMEIYPVFAESDSEAEYARELEQIGKEAYLVLKEFIESDAPEAEYFLGAAVRMKCVPMWERFSLLAVAIGSKNSSTRGRAFELLKEIDGPMDPRIPDWYDFQRRSYVRASNAGDSNT